ncbi:acetyltransferase-like isoleucine patch superfamily enzyme [Microbacterium sp. SORGH_AS 888]|nr:acetyltransferase-like isoleucine patch superfamily enzyme [Microbacterium sp. SORGH_AS_0888]
MTRKLIEFVLRRAGRSYKIDPGLSSLDLLSEVLIRGFQLVRGVFRTRNLIFIDRRVKLRGKRKIQFGKLSAVGEGSYIDGRTQRGVTLGAGAKIGRYCTISGTSHLSRVGQGFSLGERSGLGDFAHVGCSGGVYIGEDVIVGPFATFHSQEHNFGDTQLAIRQQGTTEESVVIESDVWIGARVTILAGVRISTGSVVAAGSVVRSSFPPGSVIGGIPARVLRMRMPETSAT